MKTSEENPSSTLEPRRIPSQERSRRRFDAMLDAFAALLVEKSFDAITTHMVAERAGVPVGTLYQFFPNKFALAAALSRRYEAYFEGFAEARLGDVSDLPPAEEVLDRLVDGVTGMLFADEAVIRLWAVTQVVPELEAIRAEAHEITLRLCRKILGPYLPEMGDERLNALCATISRVVYALLYAASQEGEDLRLGSVRELRQLLKAYVGSYTQA